MALGIVYYLQYYDHPRFNNLWRIEFLRENHTDPAIVFTGTGDPISFDLEGDSKNPFTPIRARSATIEIVSMTYQQYKDLFDADQKEVHCKIYQNTKMIFWGTVLQDEEYYEEMQSM